MIPVILVIKTLVGMKGMVGSGGSKGPRAKFSLISCSFWDILIKSYPGATPEGWRPLTKILDPPLVGVGVGVIGGSGVAGLWGAVADLRGRRGCTLPGRIFFHYMQFRTF